MSPNAGPPHQPEQPIRNGGTGGTGGVKVVVSPGLSAPRPRTPLYIGVPFTISGNTITGPGTEPASRPGTDIPPALAAVAKRTADAWHLTLGLPATQVPAGGTSYPVTITAIAQNVSVNLGLWLNVVDTTTPTLKGPVIPDNVRAGDTPTVTVQASDQSPGAVFSGIPATGVTVQFDGQQVPVTQTAAGDPGTWSATLPPVSHDVHTVTVTAQDAAHNSATITQQMWVQLQSWTRLEP